MLRRCGKIGDRLRAALRWWEVVLRLNISELRPWQQISTPPCHVFVDAASSPAQCGAVAFVDGHVLYTCARPNAAIWRQFAARQDRQITGLEILACAVALSTFQQELAGRAVCLYSDNTGHFLAFSLFPFGLHVSRAQAQSTRPLRAARGHGTIISWFTPFGCKLLSSTSICGSFVSPRTTTLQTYRPAPSFSSSGTWAVCGVTPRSRAFTSMAYAMTRSPARLCDC